MNRAGPRRLLAALLACAALLAAGCGTVAPRPGAEHNIDPWESWNRKIFAFNEALDEKLLEPVATTYTRAVPEPVRRGVGNVFNNFADGWSAVNNFLQGKPAPGMHDVMRFGTNTLLGLGGMLDIAGEMGLEHHYEDLGQTLATWGVAAGPYVVLPLFGPSTLREAIVLPIDRSASPALLVDEWAVRYSIAGLEIVNARAGLLRASRLLEDIALDKYIFTRDAYLQRRRSLVLRDLDEDSTDDFEYAPPSAPAAPATPASGASQPPR